MSERVIEVPVDRIIIEPEIQPRVRGIVEQHVALLGQALEVGTLPPVTVTPGREGRYLVVDGAHRVEALRRAGAKTVQARVLDRAGFWEAFVLNRDHGLPLTVEDRKRAAVWLKQNRPELTIRQIAGEVGLAPSTVHDALSQRRRVDREGAWAIRRPDPWRRFLKALVGVYERHGDNPEFVERLAQDLVDLVESTANPGLLWDALAAFAEAAEHAWKLTEHLYPEAGEANKKPQEGCSQG